MFARVTTATLLGVNAHRIDLETDLVRQGIPAFTMVGLAEGAVRESKERVFAALKNSGFRLPVARITVNLAPANMPKSGSAYDLPLALSLLAAAEIIPADSLEGLIIAGELSLTGELRPVPGILPLAILGRQEKARAVLVPLVNAIEGAVLGKTPPVYGLQDLAQAVHFLSGKETLSPTAPPGRDSISGTKKSSSTFEPDFSEVKGQEFAKRAIKVAAAGGHNLLFIGPPGSGKTMLSRRIPTVLPPLNFEESLSVTQIYSVAGLLNHGQPLISERPFRAPHHTISKAGLIGGGSYPKPGEVSMAHLGVLFLDELPEFRKSDLEVLRQPLEDGVVRISRAAASVLFPADFMLVAAMNPCPCGYLGDDKHHCTCSPDAVRRYVGKLSGPLLDRIDLYVEVPAVPYKDLRQDSPRVVKGATSASIRESVLQARKIQSLRYADLPLSINSELQGRLLKQFCQLNEDGHNFLEDAVTALGLSARAYTRILRLSRTIADLEGCDNIKVEHLAEAVAYRQVERSD